MCRNHAAPYVPVGPRDHLVRVLTAVQPPVANSPAAESSAPQLGQLAAGNVDMAAQRAAEGAVAMDGEAAESTADLEEEDEEIL